MFTLQMQRRSRMMGGVMIEWKKPGLSELTISEPPLELFYTEAGRTIGYRIEDCSDYQIQLPQCPSFWHTT